MDERFFESNRFVFDFTDRVIRDQHDRVIGSFERDGRTVMDQLGTVTWVCRRESERSEVDPGVVEVEWRSSASVVP